MKIDTLKTPLKRVSPMSSLASFPQNISILGINSNETILLFIRESKIILMFYFILYSIVLFLPFFVKWSLTLMNNQLLDGSINLGFFDSNYWTILLLLWLSFMLRGYFNIFFKWFYDINILTNNRFMDIDFISIFKNRIEETSIADIEDVKDSQTGVIQSIFNLGNLEVLTASGLTVFNLTNVVKSSKVRDFIMDVVIEERKRNINHG